MLNYIKSEYYRLTRGKGFHFMAAVLCGGVVLYNIASALGERYIPDFRYGTFRFSLNFFTGQSYIMLFLGGIVAACLFSDDRKNGVMKNAVSYGISRTKILIGKCVVCLFAALGLMIVVGAAYVGSAYLLMKEPEWLPLEEMLKGIGAALPSAIGAMVLMIVLVSLCRKEINAFLVWILIYYLVPVLLFLAGGKIRILRRIALWMPYIFLSQEAIVTYSDYNCLWNTSAGLTKCLISGLAGILLFLGIGIWSFRKQEL